VTTEKDVKNGNNRIPLNLARIYEEDMLPENDSTSQAQNYMQGSNAGDIFNDDDILKNIQHKKQALARKSSLKSDDGEGGSEQ